MIKAGLSGDTKAISIFDELPQRYYDAFKEVVSDLGEQMLEAARANAPAGKTGRLKAGNVLSITKGNDFIKAKVSNYEGAKAVATEYGATGRSHTAVAAHTMRLDHAWARAIAPMMVDVPAFTRIQNIPEQPFMRPALASVKDEFQERMQAAMTGTTDAANEEMNA
jgi:hypothetical protein